MKLLHLYISPDHNYFGHYGKPSGDAPVEEVEAIECVANKGIQGDRFFEYKPDYKGQVTFFDIETFHALCEAFEVEEKGVEIFRRNIVTEGVDLNSLIGKEFEIQGVRFLGTEEAKPCFWMDEAFCEGAEGALKGRGGLRAKILTSGTIRK